MTAADNIRNFFGKDAEFEHVGIAVKSISGALGDAEKIKDPIHKVNVAFVEINGFRAELLEPLDESSPVTNILQKGQSIYHMCFKVPDLREAVKTARKNGFHCISKPMPGKAFDNKKVVWVFSKVYGLVELLEKD